jgi:hypothetical protein
MAEELLDPKNRSFWVPKMASFFSKINNIEKIGTE